MYIIKSERLQRVSGRGKVIEVIVVWGGGGEEEGALHASVRVHSLCTFRTLSRVPLHLTNDLLH